MPFVLDCSVSASWCFEDQVTPHSEAILDRLETETAVAPPIWRLEMANVLAVAERRGRLSVAQSLQLVGFLRALPIDEDRDGDALGSVLTLAREYALSAYDAAYLEVAARQGLPLATLDERLAEAARRAGVEVLC